MGEIDILNVLFSSVTIGAALRLACPLIIGSVGGCFNEKTGTGNLAYECFMLTGAFFAAYGSYCTGSALMGSLAAMLSGIILAAIYGLLVYHLNCNAMIVSIAYNNGAWALTTLLLVMIWGVRGSFSSPLIVSYEPVTFKFLKGIPWLDTVFNNNISLVYFGYLFVIIGYIVMYKTPFGLRLRAVGLNPQAAKTAGIPVRRYKWMGLLIMGTFMGLAGSYMPLCGMSLFSENMTAGRGFLCLTAILVGKADPVKTGLIAMLFGYSNSIVIALSSYGLPTQTINMIPYILVIVVLVVSGIRNFRKGGDITNL